jgi:hypothetical protein
MRRRCRANEADPILGDNEKNKFDWAIYRRRPASGASNLMVHLILRLPFPGAGADLATSSAF